MTAQHIALFLFSGTMFAISAVSLLRDLRNDAIALAEDRLSGGGSPGDA